jgi:chromate transporter
MKHKDAARRLGEVAALFLKIGSTGFGGPAALIAFTEQEVVERRKWLSREYFLDIVGVTNLIPGPNATEIAIHVGYLRAGWPGLVVAGVCFILPAALITAAFAWAYVRYGALPQIVPFLYGIKPAVLAAIFTALWRLGRTAVKNWRLVVVGLAVALALLLGTNEVVALLAGGVFGMLWLRLSDPQGPLAGKRASGPLACAAVGLIPASVKMAAAGLSTGVPLWQLGLFFLKVGSVLYGSGYVLVAFLEGGLVRDYGWLTQQQLLDAIAIGQFTPGPVLSTATFIGYLLSGGAGAVVATVAIFLPSFVFVAAIQPLMPYLRRSRWSAAFLDAVSVSSVALMAAVVVRLTWTTLVGWPAWLIALAAAIVSLRWKVNTTWLVLGGAVLGWLLAPWAV